MRETACPRCTYITGALKDIHARVALHRREAERLKHAADVLEEIAWDIETAAAKWDSEGEAKP